MRATRSIAKGCEPPNNDTAQKMITEFVQVLQNDLLVSTEYCGKNKLMMEFVGTPPRRYTVEI
jgi:hypothetical protein